MSPCIDNLIITLVIGNETHIIVHRDLFNFFITAFYKFFFFLRNDDIAQVKRQTSLKCFLVTQVLDAIQEVTGTCHTDLLDNIADDVAQGFFRNNGIQITAFVRNQLIDNDTADRSFLNHLLNNVAILVKVVCHHTDNSMNVYLSFIISNHRFFRTVENQSFTFSSLTEFSNIIESQYHILCRHGNRRPIGRIQDIMRLKHQ